MMRVMIAFLSMSITCAAYADTSFPPASLYHLNAKLTNQSGEHMGLDAYRGRPVLVTMFYGSCAHTCPLLIETLRAVDRAASNPELRVLMISIDPERDTQAALSKIAKERHIDLNRWTLANTDAASVRKIAAALQIQYKKLPDGEFNHSSVISVLTPAGEIAKQSTTLGRADGEVVAALKAMK